MGQHNMNLASSILDLSIYVAIFFISFKSITVSLSGIHHIFIKAKACIDLLNGADLNFDLKLD